MSTGLHPSLDALRQDLLRQSAVPAVERLRSRVPTGCQRAGPLSVPAAAIVLAMWAPVSSEPDWLVLNPSGQKVPGPPRVASYS